MFEFMLLRSVDPNDPDQIPNSMPIPLSSFPPPSLKRREVAPEIFVVPADPLFSDPSTEMTEEPLAMTPWTAWKELSATDPNDSTVVPSLTAAVFAAFAKPMRTVLENPIKSDVLEKDAVRFPTETSVKVACVKVVEVAICDDAALDDVTPGRPFRAENVRVGRLAFVACSQPDVPPI